MCVVVFVEFRQGLKVGWYLPSPFVGGGEGGAKISVFLVNSPHCIKINIQFAYCIRLWDFLDGFQASLCALSVFRPSCLSFCMLWMRVTCHMSALSGCLVASISSSGIAQGNRFVCIFDVGWGVVVGVGCCCVVVVLGGHFYTTHLSFQCSCYCYMWMDRVRVVCGILLHSKTHWNLKRCMAQLCLWLHWWTWVICVCGTETL